MTLTRRGRFLGQGGTPTLCLLVLTGHKVSVPIHEKAHRLSHQLEPMLTQHGGDAFGGLTGEKRVRIQTGVECRCLTAA